MILCYDGLEIARYRLALGLPQQLDAASGTAQNMRAMKLSSLALPTADERTQARILTRDAPLNDIRHLADVSTTAAIMH